LNGQLEVDATLLQLSDLGLLGLPPRQPDLPIGQENGEQRSEQTQNLGAEEDPNQPSRG
jgi:hypothetical protein